MRQTWLGLVFVVMFAFITGRAQNAPPWFGAGNQHCSVGQGTPDNRIFVCQVWNGDPRLFRALLQLEIAHGANVMFTIETGDPIMEWHFWRAGSRIALHFRAANSHPYVLYDTATGNMVDTADEPEQPSQLPQWAKAQAQIEDEAVPESAELTRQRTAWIAKLLRQLETIHPGMTRKNLDALLTTEGGISTRFEQTYVSRECPYIKLRIRFKHVRGDSDVITEKPDDVVEAISQPYLAWSVMD